MALELTERVFGDVTVLTLKGRLILEYGAESPVRDAVDRLVRQGCLKVVLDLQGVTYIDSGGLGIIVSKYVTVNRRGGNVALLRVPPKVERVLEITKLLTVFDVFESEAEAVSSFATTT